MYHKILQILNVKPSEASLVRELFTIQFFLGVGTAFLFTASLTIFISTYEISMLPVSYVLSAFLLFVFNRLYSVLEHKLSSTSLLQVIILFSALSILVLWTLRYVFPFKQLPLIIAGWYMLIYMLVGYAFWGMASIIFNVRESKRLFSIVGAGDIPAKMLGYFSVTALVPFIGINNLMWVSIASFFIAFLFLRKFKTSGFLVQPESANTSPVHSDKHDHSIHTSGFITKFFDNRLVMSIALLSLVSYVVFSFIDFTFLSDIKVKYHHSQEIATFIAVFFAVGRIIAMGIKILFSSRMISRIGLTNALLVTPLLLLLIDGFIIVSGNRFISELYLFGSMVLVAEILRSVLQEPVFFILFQPLKPHDRLKGHLVAKGHTLPFALLAVGGFLIWYFQQHTELPIIAVGELLVALLLLWVAAVFIIKKQYLHSLVTSLKRGYFTGAELFLNDSVVTNLLISKLESKKPLEVIHSLNLLERSDYSDLNRLLLKYLQSPVTEIKEYALTRIIANNMTAALPIISQQLKNNVDKKVEPKLVTASYFLNKESTAQVAEIADLPPLKKKAAMEGLLHRKDEEANNLVVEILTDMANGSSADKLLALDVIFDCECENYTKVLETLLNDAEPAVFKKAIEATGKVRNFPLFPLVVDTTIAKTAFPSFRRSLLFYGDEIFAQDNLQKLEMKGELLQSVVKTCGNIKGEYSTAFLVQLLRKKTGTADQIIDALWLKKPQLNHDHLSLVDQWLNEKTEQAKQKVSYFFEVFTNSNAALLRNAMVADIRTDAMLMLKAFSLLYDREKVDRAIQLFGLANHSKISNAIEILELLAPKKYFIQLNIMVELIDDVRQKKELLTKTNHLPMHTIIEEVINDNKANFSEWTRSVACYMIPGLKTEHVSLKLFNKKELEENRLFNETRNYVLSTLN